MPHVFFVMSQPELPDRVLVWDTRTVSIGRAPENDLTLEDEETSRKHALLIKEGDRLEIGDYRTGNGTYVNGEPVRPKRTLANGDVVAIGKLQMELHVTEEHPAKLGHKLAYASQLKTVGMLPSGGDAGATMLGMVEMPAAADFVVEPERSSGDQAFMGGAPADDAYQVRVLDESLDDMGGLGLDGEAIDLELDTGSLDLVVDLEGESLGGGDGALDLFDPVAPPAAPAPAGVQAPPAAPVSEVRPAAQKSAPAPRAAAPQAAPAPRPAAPAPRPASTKAAPTPRPAPQAGSREMAPDARDATGGDPMERMRRLKMLHEEGLITDDEYKAKRAEILAAM